MLMSLSNTCDIKKIQQAFSKLKVTVENVMHYFFLCGLNESFHNQLLYVTRNIRPSLDEIIAKFFEANERYQVTQTAYRQKKIYSENKAKSSAYALLAELRKSSPNPFINCTLCNPNHAVNKCAKFKTSSEKVHRLMELDSCVKCGSFDHKVEKCKF